MEEFDGAQKIVQYHSEMFLGKGEIRCFLVLEHASQVFGVIVHNQKDVRKIFFFWNDNVIQFGCEYVFLHLTQILHDLNFTNNFLKLISATENIVDPFDGEYLLCFFVLGLEHTSERAFSNFPKNLVVFSDR